MSESLDELDTNTKAFTIVFPVDITLNFPMPAKVNNNNNGNKTTSTLVTPITYKMRNYPTHRHYRVLMNAISATYKTHTPDEDDIDSDMNISENDEDSNRNEDDLYTEGTKNKSDDEDEDDNFIRTTENQLYRRLLGNCPWTNFLAINDTCDSLYGITSDDWDDGITQLCKLHNLSRANRTLSFKYLATQTIYWIMAKTKGVDFLNLCCPAPPISPLVKDDDGDDDNSTTSSTTARTHSIDADFFFPCIAGEDDQIDSTVEPRCFIGVYNKKRDDLVNFPKCTFNRGNKRNPVRIIPMHILPIFLCCLGRVKPDFLIQNSLQVMKDRCVRLYTDKYKAYVNQYAMPRYRTSSMVHHQTMDVIQWMCMQCDVNYDWYIKPYFKQVNSNGDNEEEDEEKNKDEEGDTNNNIVSSQPGLKIRKNRKRKRNETVLTNEDKDEIISIYKQRNDSLTLKLSTLARDYNEMNKKLIKIKKRLKKYKEVEDEGDELEEELSENK